ncbi:hypothetical protein BGLCM_0908 [Bifidobacterium gallicum DSM 20093 = LMG 11596]|uniref:Uncharacterized protein n=1 Tax=Bifidobacterium gallicum DSM 20093 = LMG 11596 TaxID=561180 RepID=A0A087AIL7_9BIFI|nr:hypothetical protein BGLCM_0908 [Bifidobacterium gallicum DSM 20093 = LMG 11596]
MFTNGGRGGGCFPLCCSKPTMVGFCPLHEVLHGLSVCTTCKNMYAMYVWLLRSRKRTEPVIDVKYDTIARVIDALGSATWCEVLENQVPGMLPTRRPIAEQAHVIYRVYTCEKLDFSRQFSFCWGGSQDSQINGTKAQMWKKSEHFCSYTLIFRSKVNHVPYYEHRLGVHPLATVKSASLGART